MQFLSLHFPNLLPRTFSPFLLPIMAAGLLLALITGSARAEQAGDPSVFAPDLIPRSIAGMALVDLIDGERATVIINRMHRGDVATQANFIAEYQGPPGSATYYVSLYDDPRRVETDMEEMAEIMAKEGHGFSHLMRRVKNDVVFYMALGQGQAHYFFARDLELVWLAVDVDVAELAFEDVL